MNIGIRYCRPGHRTIVVLTYHNMHEFPRVSSIHTEEVRCPKEAGLPNQCFTSI